MKEVQTSNKDESSKRRRIVMTLEQKLEILNKLEAGMTCSLIGRLYQTNESTIRTIKQNEKAIRDSIQKGTPSSSKVVQYRKRDKSRKRKRTMSKHEEKIEIFDKLQAGMMCSNIGRQIHKNESKIRSIKQNKKTIRGHIHNEAASQPSPKVAQDTNKIKPRKRSRVVMTLEQKLEILDKIQGGMTCSDIGRLYHTNESTIRTIKQNEKAIRESIQNGTPTSVKVTRYPRNKVLEQAEQILSEWIKSTEAQNLPSASDIRNKAKELYEQLAQGQKCDSFCASKGWYDNFKKRFIHQHVQSPTDGPFSMSYESALLPECSVQEPKDLVLCIVKEEKEDIAEDQYSYDGPSEYSEEEKGDSFDVQFGLDGLTKFLWKAKELCEFVVDLDPDPERSMKFAEALEQAILPYQMLRDNLMMDVDEQS